MIKKLSILLCSSVLFFSCVGLETVTTFNKDGSGTMSFTYRISNMLSQMDAEGGEQAVELPFDKVSLMESLEEAEGVIVQSADSWSDENDTYVSAKVSFDNVENFYAQDEYDDMSASLTKEGGDFVYRQLISEGIGGGDMSPAEIAEEQAANQMMAPYFEGYDLKIVINAPSRIKEYNLGTISNGGKTLTFTIPMLEVQSMAEETYLQIRW